MRKSIFLSIITLALASCVSVSCGNVPITQLATPTTMPTYTPLPTYTPAPTYTPVPTYTPLGATPVETTATLGSVVMTAPAAQYTPWPTPAPWPTPTPVPNAPAEVNYYVQELVPYMEYMVYGLQAMEQAMYAYADGYITIEEVNATVEIYNEVVLTAYQGALAAVPPETLALVQETVTSELQDVHSILEIIQSTPMDQLDPDSLQQATQAMTQVKDRLQLVDRELSNTASLFSEGGRPNLENLQLQLPQKGELAWPRSGEGQLQLENLARPEIERPRIENPDRPDIQKPEIERPSRPSRK